ncbi:Lin0512 family protein [Granulosicoccus sp. 3-233]|uniref:Lin0512 family protein n=1 Tax=Granulosicoccus sp. 3-233 TaxID=3417969 RepID=UPI003D34940A
MSLKRIILEMGTGNDLYGEDYTKAARRAVHDALHHSSLTLFRTLGLNRDDMQVTVTIGVQKPEQVDVDSVAAEVPFGTVQVMVEFGGLTIEDTEAGTVTVIAAAGVEAYLDLPDEKFTLPAN